jgi:hypothetical protein
MTNVSNDPTIALNMVSVFSAILGALIGGFFLLIGQWCSNRNSYTRACKVVFVEMFDNAGFLDDIIQQINDAKSPVAPIVLPLNANTDAYLRHEEAFMAGGSLSFFSELRKTISLIQTAKTMVVLWKIGGQGTSEQSYDLLITCQEHIIATVKTLSKMLSANEKKDIQLVKLTNEFELRLNGLKSSSSRKPFMLSPLEGKTPQASFNAGDRP